MSNIFGYSPTNGAPQRQQSAQQEEPQPPLGQGIAREQYDALLREAKNLRAEFPMGDDKVNTFVRTNATAQNLYFEGMANDTASQIEGKAREEAWEKGTAKAKEAILKRLGQ
jgi:hypothetical protein